jgi:tetratricopeptide (TPR) repeat protein
MPDTMNPIDRLGAARLALELGRWSKAQALLRGDVPGPWRAERHELLGQALRAQGLLGAAVREFKAALALAREEDPAVVIESAIGAAACLRSLGDTKGAAKLLAQAAGLVRRRRFGGYESTLELESAMILRAEGDWGAALAALERIRRKGDRALRAYVDWALGGAYRFMGRLGDSVRAFESSRRLAAAEKDALGVGYAEAGLGGSTRVQGRLKDSIRHYTAALNAFSHSEDLFGLAYANCGLANGLRQAGRWVEAERFYRSAFKLYSRLEDPVDLAYVEWGLGQVLARTERPVEASQLIRSALDKFALGNETRGEVLAMVSLAALEHAAGRTARAEQLHGEAVRLAKKAGIHTHLESFT